jgi:hypothetical protein
MTTNNPFDFNLLLDAINNITDDEAEKYDLKNISRIKNNVLNNLNIPKSMIKIFKEKLMGYKYIDELPDITSGRYIRWIHKHNHKYLANGGIVCDTKIVSDGINIICKNFFNKVFEIKFKDNYIFQKFTKQEKVLLNVVHFLDKNT